MRNFHTSFPVASPVCFPTNNVHEIPFLHVLNSMLSVQFSSVAQSYLILCDLMDCSMPGFPVFISNSQSLLILKSIESLKPSSHLILCRPLLLLPSIFHSIRVFSNVSVLPISIGASASVSVLPINIQD